MLSFFSDGSANRLNAASAMLPRRRIEAERLLRGRHVVRKVAARTLRGTRATETCLANDFAAWLRDISIYPR